MSVKKIQFGIFERIVRAKDGRLFSVRFEVREVDGHMRGRIISAEPINILTGFKIQDSGFKNKTNFLKICGGCQSLPFAFNFSPFTYSVFPFYTFEFFTSQMTRAPSREAFRV